MNITITISDLSFAQASNITDILDGVEAFPQELIDANTKTLEQLGAVVIDPTAETSNAETAETFPQELIDANTETMEKLGIDVAEPTTVAELDSNGIPWDERIHSSSKKQTTKGIWNRRKGIQDFQFDEVMAELKTAWAAPAVEPIVQPALVAAPPTLPPTLPCVIAAPAAVPVAEPVAVAQPVTPVPTLTFEGFMSQMANLFAQQKIAPEYPNIIVNRINAAFGSNIATMTDIGGDERMVKYAWDCLKLDGKAA